jgi:hypothetical protein
MLFVNTIKNNKKIRLNPRFAAANPFNPRSINSNPNHKTSNYHTKKKIRLNPRFAAANPFNPRSINVQPQSQNH